MGQYYSAVLLKPNWKHLRFPVSVALSPATFDCGLKLMEFGYVGNSFMSAVELLLSTNFNGSCFAIVGDYADKKRTTAYPGAEIRITSSFKKEEKDVQKLVSVLGIKGYKTLLANKEIHIKSIKPDVYGELNAIEGVSCDFELDLYEQAEEGMSVNPDGYLNMANSLSKLAQASPNTFKYVVNHTKGEYVAIPKQGKKLKVHPLALLCADESGRGGGDYPETFKDVEYVGRWAYDNIFVTAKKPQDYTEIKPKFQTY